MGERGNSWQRQLDYWAGIPLACVSAALRRRSVTVPEVKRLGFLCLGAIGDVLLLSSLVTALRQRLPYAHLAILTSRANAAAAQLVPGIDNNATFGVREIPSMISWLRSQQFDVLVDSTQWARLGAILSNLSGAKVTVGFATPGQHRSLGYTYRVVHRNDRHEVENFLALGRVLFSDLTGLPRLALPDSPLPDVPADLRADLCAEEQRRVYLHMWPAGVHAELKEWPEACWANLATELSHRGCTVYLTGGPSDEQRNAAFLRAFPHCRARSLAGRISLRCMGALFAKAAGVVSVNTGTMHLAALAGAPTVGLHGPTNPLRWGPVGPRVRALLPRKGTCAYLNLGFEYHKPYTRCLETLPVVDVLNALHDLRVV
ncbi:MAG: glycosyltransferase family 9 protein [Desulfovibrio sp.]|nr:glycosyltransferase family 9 protein [Desulfovibrio sp.]